MIDIGANIGQTVCLFAPLRDVHVLAIEANPACVAWLRNDLQHYPDWRVDVFNLGLSDRPGTLPMIVPDFDGEEGGQGTFHTEWYVGRSKDTIEVPVTTLDHFLSELDFPKIRLWKIDVEGWELALLEGARDSLARGIIDAIFAEVHPDNRDEFAKLMAGHGYALFDIDDSGCALELSRPLPPRQDYLAIRRDRLDTPK